MSAPTRRCAALLILLLHCMVVAVGPVADAWAETNAGRAPSGLHVEDAHAPPCAPAHFHEYCLTCRALQAFDAPCAYRVALAANPEPSDRPDRPQRVAPAPQPLSPLGPRGPPVA